MQEATLAEKFRSIGIDHDYTALDLDLPVDLQGWGSDHPIFERVISEFRPAIVLEVGTWKGASVITMAHAARKHAVASQFICVDTWLGGIDGWLDAKYRQSLLLRGGYPSLFRQFIKNLQHEGISDRVFPLPNTSTAAYYILKKLGVHPNAVYIDGGHEFEAVSMDLKLYFDLLAPGGVLFGDDYDPYWSGVVRAVDSFAEANALELEIAGSKFLMCKP
ncbi:MAG: class I SAM-dependent methyltransferase [Hyphomonadaceae bacterium]|nr:class I SAM-dependent methyltransferase [Hyphomonadaceae bacterium]